MGAGRVGGAHQLMEKRDLGLDEALELVGGEEREREGHQLVEVRAEAVGPPDRRDLREALHHLEVGEEDLADRAEPLRAHLLGDLVQQQVERRLAPPGACGGGGGGGHRARRPRGRLPRPRAVARARLVAKPRVHVAERGHQPEQSAEHGDLHASHGARVARVALPAAPVVAVLAHAAQRPPVSPLAAAVVAARAAKARVAVRAAVRLEIIRGVGRSGKVAFPAPIPAQ